MILCYANNKPEEDATLKTVVHALFFSIYRHFRMSVSSGKHEGLWQNEVKIKLKPFFEQTKTIVL
jgi:hypothetical protein